MNPYHMPVEQIEDLVERHGSPIYIVSRSRIIENYRRLDRLLPAVHLFYAVKANPQPEILRLLCGAGADFDVASRGEILAAVAAGANPRENLIFADTVKDPKQIAYANSIGLDDFTFDNASEIRQIARHAPGTHVLVRLRVSNRGSLAHLSEKFGAPPGEAVDLLELARESGLAPRGVSFHVGSQCLDPGRYAEALELARGVFDRAAQRGIDLEMIDIGGGLPVSFDPEPIDLEPFCRRIVESYTRLFGSRVALVAEPGRAIVGDAAILVTRVISESVRDGRPWLYFDDGTYGSFLETLLYGVRYPLRTNTRGAVLPYVLAGPTCDSIDVFSRGAGGGIEPVALPEMHVDDLLIAGTMGAYTFSEATRFNGFEPPAFVFVD